MSRHKAIAYPLTLDDADQLGTNSVPGTKFVIISNAIRWNTNDNLQRVTCSSKVFHDQPRYACYERIIEHLFDRTWRFLAARLAPSDSNEYSCSVLSIIFHAISSEFYLFVTLKSISNCSEENMEKFLSRSRVNLTPNIFLQHRERSFVW